MFIHVYRLANQQEGWTVQDLLFQVSRESRDFLNGCHTVCSHVARATSEC